MTRDDIIRMAEEAGMPKWLQEDWFANPFDSFALKFAYLIAAAEREAIANLVEQMGIEGYGTLAIAAAIRARGQG